MLCRQHSNNGALFISCIPGSINKDTHPKAGFPGSSADKESACSAGDSSSFPGSGRSPGEGIGYPLQYSWASQVAQMVENLPAMGETLV